MLARLTAEAAGLFTISNFDDIVILALFFGRGRRAARLGPAIVTGQYLAFTAILAIAIALSYGASFLPKQGIAYLGLLPIGRGLWEAWKLWKNRGGDSHSGRHMEGRSAASTASSA